MKSFLFVGLLISILIAFMVGTTGGLMFALGWSLQYLWKKTEENIN